MHSNACRLLSSRAIAHPRALKIQARLSHLPLLTPSPFRSLPARSRWISSSVSNRDTVGSRTQRRGVRDEQIPEEDPFEGWETIIGLEIHAQMKMDHKLFSRSNTSYEEEPNSNVLPIDAGFPGTLPVLNRKAVEIAVSTALALNCKVNPRSTFDRKHYFYHDIPASYQITQHYNPIATDGQIDLSSELDVGVEDDLTVRIQQIQIEQDTAKTTRMPDGSAHVDLNRAGMGLMEIVTEADMRSPKEAGAFIRKLQGILRRIKASDGDMEKGSLRVDANVSINKVGLPFNTRCEIKNLNSVRFMMAALESERKRHLEHYLSQPDVALRQETRGFDEARGETFTLRTKEEAEDYRYMPDGNLPPVVIRSTYLDQADELLPELPNETKTRLTRQYDITLADVEVLLSMDDVEGAGVTYFEEVVNGPAGAEEAQSSIDPDPKRAVNWIVNELLGRLTRQGQVWTTDRLPAHILRSLLNMVDAGEMTGTSAKNLLKHLLDQPFVPPGLDIKSLGTEMGLITSSEDSSDSLKALCEQVIEKLPAEAESVRKGREKVVMRLVGQVMKDSKGTADAQKARTMLLAMLSSQ